MHIFKPIKLKKKHIVWYTYKYGGIMVNTYKSTRTWNGKIIVGKKYEAIIQQLWWFPYSLQIVKYSKENFVMGICGNIVKDLYHLRMWKKDNIILTLRFHKWGNIIEGYKKYRIDKKPKNYPLNYLKGKNDENSTA